MTNYILKARTPFKIAVFVIFMLLCAGTHLQAQGTRTTGDVGIGFQAGYPTGLSLQFYRETGMTTDILFAYDFNDFFFMNVHGLWDTHLDDADQFHFYYGPGVFVGFVNERNEDTRIDNPVFGFSGNLGLNFVINKFELFGQVTPRLSVVPNTDVVFGGGVGMRFFF